MPENKCETNNNKATNVFNEMLNKISGKIIATVASVLIGIAGMLYSDMNTRIKTSEDRISQLYQEKLSKEEFKSEMKEFRNSISADKADPIARIETTRQDILSRLDLILRARGIGE